MKKFLNELAHNPQSCLNSILEEKKISYAIYGYALGIISLYFSIKLITGNPAGIGSFFFVFLFWLIVNIVFNFILAALSHTFLEFTEGKSKALGIFILLGISQSFLTLLVPWCLIIQTATKIAFLTPLIFFAILLLQAYFVLTVMAKVYGLPRLSSFIAFIGSLVLPFACAICLVFFLIGWIITLIV